MRWRMGLSSIMAEGIRVKTALNSIRMPRPAGRMAPLALRPPCPAGRREPLNAIHFGGWHDQPPATRVQLAYRLVPDDYRGGSAIQLIVEHREPG